MDGTVLAPYTKEGDEKLWAGFLLGGKLPLL